LLRKQEGNK